MCFFKKKKDQAVYSLNREVSGWWDLLSMHQCVYLNMSGIKLVLHTTLTQITGTSIVKCLGNRIVTTSVKLGLGKNHFNIQHSKFDVMFKAFNARKPVSNFLKTSNKRPSAEISCRVTNRATKSRAT